LWLIQFFIECNTFFGKLIILFSNNYSLLNAILLLIPDEWKKTKIKSTVSEGCKFICLLSRNWCWSLSWDTTSISLLFVVEARFPFANSPMCLIKKTTQHCKFQHNMRHHMGWWANPTHHGFNPCESDSWWARSKIDSYWNLLTNFNPTQSELIVGWIDSWLLTHFDDSNNN